MHTAFFNRSNKIKRADQISAKNILELCIILSCISSKKYSKLFDTYFSCIRSCWDRPRGLQNIVYFNWGSTCRNVWEPL